MMDACNHTSSEEESSGEDPEESSSSEEESIGEDSEEAAPSPKRRKVDRLVRGKPWPKDMVRKLDTLYYAGMNGWGESHQNELRTAMASTGLSFKQVKVHVCVLNTTHWWSQLNSERYE